MSGAANNNIHSFIDYLDSTAEFDPSNTVNEKNTKYVDESIINIAFTET